MKLSLIGTLHADFNNMRLNAITVVAVALTAVTPVSRAEDISGQDAFNALKAKSDAEHSRPPFLRLLATPQVDTDRRITESAEERFRRWTNRIGVVAVDARIPLAKLDRIAFGENPDAASYKHLKIRATWEELTEPFEESKPAQFSYARNLRDKENIWNAHGAAAFVFEQVNWPAELNGYPLNRLSFAPGLEFDRVSGGPEETQADSLVLKTGASADFVSNDRDSLWRGHVINLTPVYATDFHFRSSQFGIELNYKPILECVGLNSHRQDWLAFGPFAAQFTLTVHAEGGHVFDSGRKSGLHEGDGFGRVGPLAGVQLKLNRQKEVRGYVKWDQRETFIDGSNSTRLFTGGISWALINESLLLSVEYRRGRIPLSVEKVKTIAVTLGVKL